MDRFLYILMLTCAAIAAGCASLRPAVPSQAAERVAEAATLTVIEGRPASLLLRATFVGAQNGDVLELTRSRSDEEALALVRVELEDSFLELAQGPGIGLSDDGVESAQAYRYRVHVYREGEPIAESAALEIGWGEAPPRPEEVAVVELAPQTVEVSWTPSGAAALFVRDVLDASARPRRIDVGSVAQGRHLLRGLAPAGVYAVRVALADDGGEFLRYGPASEEVYVTVSEPSEEEHHAEGS